MLDASRTSRRVRHPCCRFALPSVPLTLFFAESASANAVRPAGCGRPHEHAAQQAAAQPLSVQGRARFPIWSSCCTALSLHPRSIFRTTALCAGCWTRRCGGTRDPPIPLFNTRCFDSDFNCSGGRSGVVMVLAGQVLFPVRSAACGRVQPRPRAVCRRRTGQG